MHMPKRWLAVVILSIILSVAMYRHSNRHTHNKVPIHHPFHHHANRPKQKFQQQCRGRSLSRPVPVHYRTPMVAHKYPAGQGGQTVRQVGCEPASCCLSSTVTLATARFTSI